MIDRRPAAIARCAEAADVISAVNFGRSNGLLVSVRGGGHNVSGNAVCDGGLMIDLSPMKSVRVDPQGKTVRAEAGVTWGGTGPLRHGDASRLLVNQCFGGLLCMHLVWHLFMHNGSAAKHSLVHALEHWSVVTTDFFSCVTFCACATDATQSNAITVSGLSMAHPPARINDLSTSLLAQRRSKLTDNRFSN